MRLCRLLKGKGAILHPRVARSFSQGNCCDRSVAVAFAREYNPFIVFGDSKLKKRLSDLEESLQRIEHAFKKLEVEWTETYDKFRQLHWRVAKRAKQLEEANAELGEPTAPPGTEITESATGLTPKQLEAQAAVMARRQRRVNGGQ